MPSARNLVWILCFSPHLETVAASFTISAADANWLSEHSIGFKRKTSVKELAILPHVL